MKKIKLLIILLFFAVAANAQSGTKIAYVDADYILSQMPELKVVESELTTFGGNLQNQIKAKYDEYQAKLKEYQSKAATMSDLDRQSTEQEIRDMQGRITKYEQDAQVELQKKQKSLMEPLQNKIGDAIKAVAEAEGVDVILAAGLGGMDIVLFASDNSDLTDKVFAKLGITPPAN